MKVSDVFERCTTCNGTGKVECCKEYMCPGVTRCTDCRGKKKRPKAEYKELLKQLEEWFRR